MKRAIFYGISSQMGQIVAGVSLSQIPIDNIYSSQILNMSDYSRFATKPKDQIISQIVIVPVLGIMTTVIGIICTSTAAQFYPDKGLLWEPYSLLRAIQEEGGAGARAAVFFACTFSTDYVAALIVSIRILDCSVWYQYCWQCYLRWDRSSFYVSKVHQSEEGSLYRELQIVKCEKGKSLTLDYRDGSSNVPMGALIGRDGLHQRHGWLCYFLGAYLRSHGQRLPSRTKG